MKINELPYAIRFEFSCSDGWGFATDDIEILNDLKSEDNVNSIDRLVVGNIVHIKRSGLDETIKCAISQIEIRDIIFDTETPIKGIWGDGFSEKTTNKDGKDELLTIHVKLNVINK